MPGDRQIAAHEAVVVRWLLDHAAVGEVTDYRIQPVEDLRVTKGCDCGCFSLAFQPRAWGGARIIADSWAVYSDAQKADLILWGREGEIVLLEIVDNDPRLPHRFPEISNLGIICE
ncbi:MAG TPA: hypothetical protein VNV86_16810 [Candidatus Acidoferrum sp.]|nr:hypothetical protein [Candidatus Acidoferrum sp.]